MGLSHLVPTGPLGFIQRRVCSIDKGSCVGVDGRSVGNSDAQCDYSRRTSVMANTKCLDRASDTLGNNGCVGGPTVVEHNSKFLSRGVKSPP